MFGKLGQALAGCATLGLEEGAGEGERPPALLGGEVGVARGEGQPVPLADAVDVFMLQREASDRPTTWYTVIGFLARLRETSPLDVPPEVGLAFWGQVELVLR